MCVRVCVRVCVCICVRVQVRKYAHALSNFTQRLLTFLLGLFKLWQGHDKHVRSGEASAGVPIQRCSLAGPCVSALNYTAVTQHMKMDAHVQMHHIIIHMKIHKKIHQTLLALCAPYVMSQGYILIFFSHADGAGFWRIDLTPLAAVVAAAHAKDPSVHILAFN